MANYSIEIEIVAWNILFMENIVILKSKIITAAQAEWLFNQFQQIFGQTAVPVNAYKPILKDGHETEIFVPHVLLGCVRSYPLAKDLHASKGDEPLFVFLIKDSERQIYSLDVLDRLDALYRSQSYHKQLIDESIGELDQYLGSDVILALENPKSANTVLISKPKLTLGDIVNIMKASQPPKLMQQLLQI